VARTGDSFNFAQKIGFGFVVLTVILMAKLLNPPSVGLTQILSYNLLSDVTTDIFSVVARFFRFLLLFLRLEQFGAVVLELVSGVEGENERAFAVGWSSNQLGKNRIIGFLAREDVR